MGNVTDGNLIELDGQCTKPHLLPGDVIETMAGNIGVITCAKTTINGRCISWNEKMPEVIEHGHIPCYCVEFFEGNGAEKHAWWYSSEFKRVVALGVVRDYLGEMR